MIAVSTLYYLSIVTQRRKCMVTTMLIHYMASATGMLIIAETIGLPLWLWLDAPSCFVPWEVVLPKINSVIFELPGY